MCVVTRKHDYAPAIIPCPSLASSCPHLISTNSSLRTARYLPSLFRRRERKVMNDVIMYIECVLAVWLLCSSVVCTVLGPCEYMCVCRAHSTCLLSASFHGSSPPSNATKADGKAVAPLREKFTHCNYSWYIE